MSEVQSRTEQIEVNRFRTESVLDPELFIFSVEVALKMPVYKRLINMYI